MEASLLFSKNSKISCKRICLSIKGPWWKQDNCRLFFYKLCLKNLNIQIKQEIKRFVTEFQCPQLRFKGRTSGKNQLKDIFSVIKQQANPFCHPSHWSGINPKLSHRYGPWCNRHFVPEVYGACVWCLSQIFWPAWNSTGCSHGHLWACQQEIIDAWGWQFPRLAVHG